jgi:hypothetical protein
MELKLQIQKNNPPKKSENDAEIESNCSSNKSYDSKNNQSEDSIISNNATCSSGCVSNCSFQSSQIINIKLFYYINKDLKNTEILIQEDKTINDLICFSLNIINEELISNKLNIQLDTSNYKKYCLFLIKKKEDIKDINKISSLNPDSFLSNYSNMDSLYFLKWLDTKINNVIPYERKNNNYYLNKREINSIKKNNHINKFDINEIKSKNNNGEILLDDDNNCIIF